MLGAEYGALPDMAAVDPAHDVVLAWNGTTSGVRFPDGDFIASDREGLVICDATSAAFAMDLPWDKLDVVTWSWQKVLGGEAAHGMLALSPRAVARLLSYKPPRPLPKIFRLTSGGKLIEGIFVGETINTPSMLCVEDALDGLRWAESIGGLPGLIARSEANLACIADWVAASDWASFLARDAAARSSTSICLTINAPWFTALDAATQAKAAKRLAALLDAEGVAYDIALLSGRAAGPAHLGRGPRSRPPISRPCCPGSTGPMPNCSAITHPRRRRSNAHGPQSSDCRQAVRRRHRDLPGGAESRPM